jgi:hypothetical protein
MVLSIFRVTIGCMALYIIGWLDNRKPFKGFEVPKLVSLMCGKKEPILNASGLAAQWISKWGILVERYLHFIRDVSIGFYTPVLRERF